MPPHRSGEKKGRPELPDPAVWSSVVRLGSCGAAGAFFMPVPSAQLVPFYLPRKYRFTFSITPSPRRLAHQVDSINDDWNTDQNGRQHESYQKNNASGPGVF